MSYKVEKDWEHKGLRCVVLTLDVRHRCGYVGVTESHVLFGRDYRDKIPESLLRATEKIKEEPVGKRGIIDVLCAAATDPADFKIGLLFDVHGSITYSGKGNYPVESQLWWFGFDCVHYGDACDESIMSDKYASRPHFVHEGVVRTLDYCITECESLADQLKGLLQ